MLDARPRSAEVKGALARAFGLEREHRLAEAAEAYQEAIRREPQDLEILMRLALVLRAAGRDGEANLAYEEAHRLCLTAAG
jgi:Flp pilus assembly protein TadD